MPNLNLLRFALGVVLLLPLSCKVVRADGQATVIKVVDGDTLDVRIGNRKQRVRLIGVDTSELHESDKLVRDAARSQCSEAALQDLGAEATAFVVDLLALLVEFFGQVAFTGRLPAARADLLRVVH